VAKNSLERQVVGMNITKNEITHRSQNTTQLGKKGALLAFSLFESVG
jgi:hypothetical protein